jgi:hypothetical protein
MKNASQEMLCDGLMKTETDHSEKRNKFSKLGRCAEKERKKDRKKSDAH